MVQFALLFFDKKCFENNLNNFYQQYALQIANEIFQISQLFLLDRSELNREQNEFFSISPEKKTSIISLGVSENVSKM